MPQTESTTEFNPHFTYFPNFMFLNRKLWGLVGKLMFLQTLTKMLKRKIIGNNLENDTKSTL